ncbi:oligosaccharyltransferase complex subunit ostc-A isoform X2 [Macrosteles quadrilineatus]|uniref:oligosaccharyltransferase complex subunit ostc-A isoform X2 n=1 Tax=Macrosteles quadrilineatus TaxID=74068 RepID=UPI0023E2A8CF|nr:oligosaccharyltransferase complex subunit ostc-A isoform X2 [Macrosteles quadrilineatus]
MFFTHLYSFLEVPRLQINIRRPSNYVMYGVVLTYNFALTAGIIYDVIIEPPSVGSTTDEHGHSRPVAFLPYRVNGQYIMEGLASSFLFTLGGLGFVVLDHTHNPSTPKLNRILLIAVGFLCIIISFFTCWVFMRMKLPGYLRS